MIEKEEYGEGKEHIREHSGGKVLARACVAAKESG